MNISRYQSITKNANNLPSLPAIAAQVMGVVGNPESSSQDLKDIVLQDQSMSSAILKIANSVLFGRPKEVTDLEQAITILGFNEIQSIVLGKALFNTFHTISDKHDAMKSFWHHAFATAISATIIAKKNHRSAPQAFISGLIHDIGKLAILATFPNDYKTTLWLGNENICARLRKEIEECEISHDEIGAQLLEQWLFPETLIAPVKYHHLRTEDTYSQDVLIVAAANMFSHYYQLDQSGGSIPELNDYIATEAPLLIGQLRDAGIQCESGTFQLYYDQLTEEMETNTTISSLFAP